MGTSSFGLYDGTKDRSAIGSLFSHGFRLRDKEALYLDKSRCLLHVLFGPIRYGTCEVRIVYDNKYCCLLFLLLSVSSSIWEGISLAENEGAHTLLRKLSWPRCQSVTVMKKKWKRAAPVTFFDFRK